MLKLLRKIFLTIIIACTIIVGAISVFALQYEDELKAYVISELQANLTRDIELGVKRMDYSVFSHFPNISVKIPDLKIESPSKEDRSLVQIAEVNLAFDLISIIKGDFLLNEISLKKGAINIIYSKDGIPNFLVWKKSDSNTETSSTLSIKNIELQDVLVSYQDQGKGVDYQMYFNALGVKPTSVIDSVVLNSSIKGNLLILKQGDFLWKEETPLEGTFELFNSNQVVSFEYLGEVLEKEAFVNGSISKKENDGFWDLKFGVKNLGLASTVEKLPDNLKSRILEGISGAIDLEGSITGKKNSKVEPAMNIQFNVRSGGIVLGNSKLSDITLNGLYAQPKMSDVYSGSIKIKRFNCGFNSSTLSGNILVNSFKRPWIKSNIKANLNLGAFHKEFGLEGFERLDGNVKIETEFEGYVKSMFSKSNSTLKGFKSKGSIKLDNVEIAPVGFGKSITFRTGDLSFDDRDLNITALYGKVKSSNFEMTGEVSNFLETILWNKPITFKSSLKVDKLVVEEFVTAEGSAKSDSNYFFSLPKDLVLDVKLDLGKFSFRKFNAQSLKGGVLLKNEQLKFNDLQFETCSGKADVSGKIDAKHGSKVIFECVADIKNIDAKMAFNQLENFGQDVLLAKHVKGEVSADIYLLAETDKQLNILKDKIYTKTNLKIHKGELNHFAPLVELQTFMKKEFKLSFDLENLKFKTIENDIEIINKKIFIPEMAIRTNDINMDISGQHTFNQEIDYLFKVKHSEIFKASKKNQIEEKYGVIENEDKTATLPLKMTGTVDHPKFSYDIKKKGEIIKENIRQELKTIKDALKKEFLGDKKKQKKRAEEDKELNEERERVKFKVGDIDDEGDEDEYEEEF